MKDILYELIRESGNFTIQDILYRLIMAIIIGLFIMLSYKKNFA